MESILVAFEYVIFLVPLLYILYYIYNHWVGISESDNIVVDLILCVAMVDKTAQQEELNFIAEHFFSSSRYLSNPDEAYEKFKTKLGSSEIDFLPSLQKVDDLCSGFLKECPLKYDERLSFLDSLFQIAYIHEGVSDEELRILECVSRRFVIKDWDLISLKYKYEYNQNHSDDSRKQNKSGNGKKESSGQNSTRFRQFCDARHSEAFAVLGVNVGADVQGIKTAYRSLVKQCHPDMLSPNLSEEEKELSLARFRHIQEAYDFLMEESVILYS